MALCRLLLAYTIGIIREAKFYRSKTVCVCSCEQVSCWSGSHEEAGERSGTRVWQTVEGTPSAPGSTNTQRQTNHTFACKYKINTFLTEDFYLFFYFYLIHRISRVLKTKRISNHRDTVTVVSRHCFYSVYGCLFFSVDHQRPYLYCLLPSSFFFWTEAHIWIDRIIQKIGYCL